MDLRETLNFIWSVGTVVAQIISLPLLLALVFPRFRNLIKPFFDFFADRALVFAFIFPLLAMTGSLLYSDVLGYEPCKLCWFQRILMYPQVIIFAIAIFKKDTRAFLYGIVLSAIGMLVSFYHYLIQLGVKSPFPCSATGYSVSCSKNFVLQFNYITIPMMAFAVFTLTMVILIAGIIRNKEKNV